MTDAAAFAGTYADFKTVKTRSAFQVIVEMPIEHAERFIAAFGMPIPGAEKPVALALLRSSTDKPAASAQQRSPSAERRRWSEMSYAQRSGILRNDEQFMKWIGTNTPGGAASYIRLACGVESCSEIDGNERAMVAFDSLDASFRGETGQMAEVRG